MMAIKKYTLNPSQKPTSSQIKEIENASKLPLVFDEDSPELTDEQLAQFHRVKAARHDERVRQNITLRLKPATIRKAKALGKGYSGILSRIIESVLDDPATMEKYL